MSKIKLIDRIDEYFQLGCGPNGVIDIKSAFKLLWPTLNNSVSVVDLAGVFSISIPSNNPVEALSRELFHDFFKAYARLKYASGADYCEKLLDELRHTKAQQKAAQNSFNAETNLLYAIADKNVIRVFLKFDLPLRRAFSAFCGQAVRVGGLVSWDEVKTLSLGMEIDGFLSLAGAYSLLPHHISSQQCEIMFREIISKYSILANSSTLHSSLLFPQFQLLLIMIAVERAETLMKKSEKVDKIFAKKPNEGKSKILTDCLVELFKDMGINKFDEKLSYPLQYDSPTKDMRSTFGQSNTGAQLDMTRGNFEGGEPQSGGDFSAINTTGNITLPLVTKREDLYAASTSNAKQITSLRLDHLFEELQQKLLERIYGMIDPSVTATMNLGTMTLNNTTVISPTATTTNINTQLFATTGGGGGGNNTLTIPKLFDPQSLINVIQTKSEETVDTKAKLPTKPVVICDALPIPANTPDTIDQLLEAALAHHNLGSFEDSLKFLEASRVQLMEIIETMKKKAALYSPAKKASTNNLVTSPDGKTQATNAATNNNNTNTNNNNNNNTTTAATAGGTGPLSQTQIIDNIDQTFLDLRLYLIICKGNVYQSCGDDEQSLVQYLEGFHLAHSFHDYDWEIICLNSIGVLAFFNLRYDVAILCFYLVYEYRERMYGQESQDTATALNNLGCCLYCLNRRGEARLKFERAWNILSMEIGHRAARTVLVWKNLEKARRSHASQIQNKKDMKESIAMRPDADKIIPGGTFRIQAVEIAEGKSKKKKGGKKKKGK